MLGVCVESIGHPRSAGRTIFSPSGPSNNSLTASTWSSSTIDWPTSWPCAWSNVKHIPPPISIASILGNRLFMTPSLSLTLLSRLFFVSGGSEAVETAIKIAKQVQAMRGFPKRYKIIARRRSYHGMTYGAMSVTATRNETWFGPFMYGVYHVPHPDRYRCDFGCTSPGATGTG